MQPIRYYARNFFHRPNGGEPIKRFEIFDGVTCQRHILPPGTTEAQAQQVADKLDAECAHQVATQYVAVELPYWTPSQNWRILDMRRAEGHQASCALARKTLPRETAIALAEYANRCDPAWNVGTVELLAEMTGPKLKAGQRVKDGQSWGRVETDQAYGKVSVTYDNGVTHRFVPVSSLDW